MHAEQGEPGVFILIMDITKEQLRNVQKHRGKLDHDTGKVFLGFVGALDMSTKLYRGYLKYEEVDDANPPKESVSINEVLEPSRPTKKKRISDGDAQDNV